MSGDIENLNTSLSKKATSEHFYEIKVNIFKHKVDIFKFSNIAPNQLHQKPKIKN